jgi:hypothetical protein
MAGIDEGLRQRAEARRFDPVVIGDEDPHARTVAVGLARPVTDT